MIGNGENALVELIDSINGKLDISKVSNVLYKRSGKIIYNNQISIHTYEL